MKSALRIALSKSCLGPLSSKLVEVPESLTPATQNPKIPGLPRIQELEAIARLYKCPPCGPALGPAPSSHCTVRATSFLV